MYAAKLAHALYSLLGASPPPLPMPSPEKRKGRKSRRHAMNPEREAARRLHADAVRKDQSEGREWAYLRKLHRAAKYAESKQERQQARAALDHQLSSRFGGRA